MKSGGFSNDYPKNVQTVLSAIGGCLDSLDNFYAITTTLDQNPLLKITTESGRTILWATLPAANLNEALSLFEKPLFELLLPSYF